MPPRAARRFYRLGLALPLLRRRKQPQGLFPPQRAQRLRERGGEPFVLPVQVADPGVLFRQERGHEGIGLPAFGTGTGDPFPFPFSFRA